MLLRLPKFVLQNKFDHLLRRNFKVLQPFNRLSHTHRTAFNMEKVYLRKDDEEKLYINFHYENMDLRINRDFNFCRNINENVNDALARIKNNVEKELNKRSKKGKKALAVQETELTKLPSSEVSIEFLREDNQTSIRDVTFAEMLRDWNNNLKMSLLDRTYQIVLNQPWVINLVLPNSLLAGFIVYPNKLELQFADRNHCQGVWMRAKKPSSGNVEKDAEWEECGRGLSYTTKNNDVGYFLKLIVTPGNAEGVLGPSVEHIAKQEIQAGPGVCPYETRHIFTQNLLDGQSLRVVSYNILADLYADSEFSRKNLFPYCPSYALAIDYRKQLFLKEIVGYNADIVCLQEVDMKIFDLDLKPVLEGGQLNYCGHIAQKGKSGEGVAIFYRSERFELISTHEVNIGENLPNLKEFEAIWLKVCTNSKLVQRICDRATTLQVLRLKHKQSGRVILVCNTHLYFHPDADHVRLLQIGLSMLYVRSLFEKTVTELKLQDRRQASIIFCGDFNSTPECGIYKLMTEGFVGADFVDWNSNVDEAVENVSLKQPFKMQSACGTPKFTNYTHAFAACLDYIFFQNDRFEVEQVVPFPTDEELKAHVAIPSVVFPSDHVALVADLRFKQV